MKLSRFVNVFRKSLDITRRARAAFDEGLHRCESCGHASPLATLPPLTIVPCPSCGFKGLVPYRLNDYLLFEPLGAGGVSSVYKALHRDSYSQHRLFAAKLLRSDKSVDEAILDEFLREGEIHHAVSPHPGIAQFIELGHSDGEYFHIMEFIPGESVKTRVESSGRILEPLALKWLLETTQALHHIRDKGFLYRDISPGNLLIRGDQSVCLIDFGLALPIAEADAAEQRSIVVGTPEYLPPERVQQLGEDERSSIYGLGMLLFFMLKGEPLIKGGTHAKAALQHVSSIRVAFNERMLPPDTTPEAVALLGHMIKYDPVDRPATFEEVEATLTRLLAR